MCPWALLSNDVQRMKPDQAGSPSSPFRAAQTAMETVKDDDGNDKTEIDGLDMDTEGYIYAAARTKPANTNKYAKGMGAQG